MQSPSKRDTPIEPWEVEIGRLTKTRERGIPKVIVMETDATIQAGERSSDEQTGHGNAV